MKVTSRVIEQRIRNRLLEWLEAAASSEQNEDDLNALVNQWVDWTNDEPVSSRFSSSAFTSAELHALSLVQAEIKNFCDATPEVLSVECWPKWHIVKASAGAALACLSVRGVLPENEE